MLPLRAQITAIAAACLLAGAGTAVAAPASHGTTAGRPSASARAAGLENGGFETPRVTPNTFRTFSAGQSIGPWRVTSRTVDLIGAGFWQAAQGVQSVDLNGVGAGGVQQTFSTRPGKTYTVTYALAGNPGGTPVVKTGKVLIDGQNMQNFSFDTTGKTRTAMGYVNRRVTFVANGASTTLAFVSTTANSAWGPVIDNVRVRGCGCGCCCG